MAGKYVVSASLATPYQEDGTRAYLYQGAEWPEGLRDGETERFVDLGFLSEVEDKPVVKKTAASK